MTGPGHAQVLVAELRVVTGPGTPTATAVCHRCGAERTVTGHDAVRDFVHSAPLDRHRPTCPGRPPAGPKPKENDQ